MGGELGLGGGEPLGAGLALGAALGLWGAVAVELAAGGRLELALVLDRAAGAGVGQL